MDHFIANSIEYTNKARSLNTIKSDFNHVEKVKILQKGEIHLHNKEKDMQNAFFLKLRNEIVNYDEVLLFGSTTAKTELANILNDNNDFRNIKITLKNTDKLTEKQQIACFDPYKTRVLF